MTNALMHEAFAPFAADVEVGYVKHVMWVLTDLLARYPTGLNKLSSSWGADGGAYRALRTFLDGSYARRGDTNVTINTDRLAKRAKEYAMDTVEAFALKLEAKLGNVVEFNVSRASTVGTYLITAKKGDKKILVEQQCVFKTSKNGVPFNQWPARIYVNGAFTPAAKFEAAIG